jgi:hypothetical protein
LVGARGHTVACPWRGNGPTVKKDKEQKFFGSFFQKRTFFLPC